MLLPYLGETMLKSGKENNNKQTQKQKAPNYMNHKDGFKLNQT